MSPTPSDSSGTVTLAPAALRSASRERAAVAAADLLRSQPGVEPVERGAFGRIAALWAAGRVLNLALLWGFFELSRAFRWGFGPDDYLVRSFLDFLTGWDADRYGAIAQEGYPIDLPRNADGDILPNNWAFLPVFPLLVRGISATGLSWQVAAILVSVVAGLGATWMLFLLLRAIAPPRTAAWAVTVFTFAPLSFVLVLGYSEGLFLLLTFAALLLAVRRRYAWIAPIGVTAAFTRPGALALALALGILFIVRIWGRREDEFPPREAIGLFAAGAATAIAGLSWPVIADAVTGVAHAYVRTEIGWWLPSVGSGAFIPFSPWFRQAGTHLGILGIVVVIVVVLGFAALVQSRSVRRLGIVVVAYVASYGLYLFAVFLPQQSIFRLIMPLSPLLADHRLSSTRARRTGVLGGCAALQVVAVWLFWAISHP